IRVLAHEGRHVEGHRKSRLAVGQEVLVAPIRFLCRGEAGELARRPQPAAIAARMDAARVGELAWELLFTPRPVLAGVERLERDPRDRRGLDVVVADRAGLEVLPPHLLRIARPYFQVSSLSVCVLRISSAVRYGVPSFSKRSASPASFSNARRARPRASSAATSAVSSRSRFSLSSCARPLLSRWWRWARIASHSASMPSSLVATVGTIGGRQAPLGAMFSIVRSSATTRL